MNQKAIIETHNLTKTYGNQVAVNDLTFSIEEGEIFGFLGPNGSGKTTTLLMLIGLTEPTKGWARVADFDPTKEAIKVKEIVGYIPENIGFYDDMNAIENLLFIARLNNIPDAVSSPKIEEALESVGLKEEAEKKDRSVFPGNEAALGDCRDLLKGAKSRIFR